MISNKLSIAIPTCNRAEILRENLLHILPEIIEFGVPLYISDDGMTGETEHMLLALKQHFPLIVYRRNPSPLGHDLNCIQTISWPDTEYVWYLGDAIQILAGSISKMISIINAHSPTMIGVNSEGRKHLPPTQIFGIGKDVMLHVGWHLTLTGSCIYHTSVAKKADALTLEKYPNFPQTGLIFETLSNDDKTFYWVGEKTIEGNRKKISYWYKYPFEVFLRDWVNLINNSPQSYDSIKQLVIPMHARYSGFFSIRNLIIMRYHKALNPASIKKYKHLFLQASDQSYLLIQCFSLLPHWIFYPVILFRQIKMSL